MNFEEWWDKECCAKIFYVPWDEEPIARKAWEEATENERTRIINIIKSRTEYDSCSDCAQSILNDIGG